MIIKGRSSSRNQFKRNINEQLVLGVNDKGCELLDTVLKASLMWLEWKALPQEKLARKPSF